MIFNQLTPVDKLVPADCWLKLLLSLWGKSGTTDAAATVVTAVPAVSSNGTVALPGFSFILAGYIEKDYKDTL